MDPMCVIVVGLRMGANWVKAAQQVDGIELAGVVDIDPARLSEVASEADLTASQCFAELSAAQHALQADVAVLALPNHLHLPFIQQAFENGLHVICEKPLAESMPSALTVRALCRQYSERKFMVGQNYRWLPAVEAVRQAIAGGVIGAVSYVNLDFQKAMRFGGWRQDLPEVLLEDMSIHHFDLLRFVLNAEPIDVFARTHRPAWSWHKGRPNASCLWRMSGGVEVAYTGSWVAPGQQTSWHGAWRIAGEKGAIHWDNGIVLPTLYHLAWDPQSERDAPTFVQEPLAVVDMPYTGQAFALTEMRAALAEDRQPQTNIEDNLRSFAMSRAAVESAKLDRVVALAELLPS